MNDQKRLLEISEELASWIAARRGVPGDSVRVHLSIVGMSALQIHVTVDGRNDEPAEQAVGRLLSCGSDAFKILTEHRKVAGFLWEVP